MEIALTWEGSPHDRGKCLHVVGLKRSLWQRPADLRAAGGC